MNLPLPVLLLSALLIIFIACTVCPHVMQLPAEAATGGSFLQKENLPSLCLSGNIFSATRQGCRWLTSFCCPLAEWGGGLRMG